MQERDAVKEILEKTSSFDWTTDVDEPVAQHDNAVASSSAWSKELEELQTQHEKSVKNVEADIEHLFTKQILLLEERILEFSGISERF